MIPMLDYICVGLVFAYTTWQIKNTSCMNKPKGAINKKAD